MLSAPAAKTDSMYRLAVAVASKKDLQRFVDGLADDYAANGAVWVNHSIPDFLRALACCLRLADGMAVRGEAAQATPPADWQYIARALLAASVARDPRHGRRGSLPASGKASRALSAAAG